MSEYEQWLEKERQKKERSERLSRREFWTSLVGGDGQQFENAVKEFLEEMGYSATTTRVSGDHGIDIDATKNGKYYAIQCKALKGKAQESHARDLIGTVNIYNYDGGMLFSLNGVTDNVRKTCQMSNKPIEIWTVDELQQQGAQFLNCTSSPIDEKPNKNGYSIGDVIEHSSFGIGVVVDVDEFFITVEFDSEVKELFTEKAPIKKI